MVSVLLAFLPAVFVGLLAHDFIKNVLFETPMLVAVMLILGGFILLAIDRIAPPPVHRDALALPFGKSLAIGFCRCVAIIPGSAGRGRHRRCAADGGGEAGGGRVFLSAVPAHDGRGGGL